MSSSLIIALEMGGVLGAVLIWGVWELWTLRREKRKDRLKELLKGASDSTAARDRNSSSGR